MKRAYRSHVRLVMDVLAAVQSEGPVGVTRLALLANTSHPRLQEYLAFAEEKGWIAPAEDDTHTKWCMTDAGNRALQELRRVDDAMKDFGLRL